MNILEKAYYIGYSIKKKYAISRQQRLPYPVISIGNITVGGTGKTPLAIAISEEAVKRGFFPIILTRGYKGKAKGPCIVSPKKNNIFNISSSDLCTTTLEAGDEPLLMAERLVDVPVIKCGNRYKGGIFVLKNLVPHIVINSKIVFILDDGFQHWKLFRDIDIVLIDSTNPFGNYRLLPSGILREPLSELRRADIALITKVSDGKDNLDIIYDTIHEINPEMPVFISNHKLSRLLDAKGNQLPIDLLRERKIFIFSAIGNPETFLRSFIPLGVKITGVKKYRDHHRYTDKNVLNLIKQATINGADFLITTEKDMVKLRELNPPDNMLCTRINLDVNTVFYDQIFNKIDKNYHHQGG